MQAAHDAPSASRRGPPACAPVILIGVTAIILVLIITVFVCGRRREKNPVEEEVRALRWSVLLMASVLLWLAWSLIVLAIGLLEMKG